MGLTRISDLFTLRAMMGKIKWYKMKTLKSKLAADLIRITSRQKHVTAFQKNGTSNWVYFSIPHLISDVTIA